MVVGCYIDFSKKVNGEFEIHELLGSRYFGSVYRVRDRNGKDRAAKFFEAGHRALFLRESRAIMSIGEKRVHGTVYKYYAGVHGCTYVIVMDLLGESISDLHDSYGGLKLKSVLMIGLQVIHNIKNLHNRDLLHGDIKPKHIVIGRKGKDRGYVYLIHFGLSDKYTDEYGEHQPREFQEYFCGSAVFSSVAAASFRKPSRRCDLESLLYVLIFLIKGSLPWESQTLKEARETKKQTSIETLCHGLPDELKLSLRYVKALGYSEPPDYSKLSSYLKIALENAGHTVDNKFEWNE